VGLNVDPTLYTAALAAAERAANGALTLSPHSQLALRALADTVIGVQCTRPAFTVFVAVEADGLLAFKGHHEGEPTASVRGSSSDFAELARSADPAATLINGGLELRGASAPLIELQGILAELDIDWEAPLVQALGDVAGHQLAQLLRGGLRFGRQAASSLSRQLEEYIHEEGRLSPPRAEVEDFYNDLQSLVLQVDRLASRLQRLRTRAGSGPNTRAGG
jgi:ubiquinone biosynthesis protein UbiJ